MPCLSQLISNAYKQMAIIIYNKDFFHLINLSLIRTCFFIT